MMRELKLQAIKTKVVLADKCHVAECFTDRLKGLLGRDRLEPGEGMFFPRCNSVHMWFMRFPIDVVFVDHEWRVTSVHESVRPWRLLPVGDLRARHALELPVGSIRRAELRKGDGLCSS